MKPILHAKIAAKKHGGTWEDYLDIGVWFDQTKAHVADMRHRAILHNSFGVFLCAQQLGEIRKNSAGKEYSVRDVAEDHVLEDLGMIPSLAQVIESIGSEHLKWLGGPSRAKKKIYNMADVQSTSETIELLSSATLPTTPETMKLAQEAGLLSKKLDKLFSNSFKQK